MSNKASTHLPGDSNPHLAGTTLSKSEKNVGSNEKSVEPASFSETFFLTAMDKATSIEVLGCNPMAALFTSADFYVNLRKYIERRFDEEGTHSDAKTVTHSFSIYVENDQDDFSQKLLDRRGSAHFKLTYIEKKGLIFGENQSNYQPALVTEIVNRLTRKYKDDGKETPEGLIDFAKTHVIVKQLNLRIPFNCIRIDEKIWYYPLTLNVPDLDQFIFLDKADRRFETIYTQVQSYLTFLKTDDANAEQCGFKPLMGGGKFLSLPGDELIEAYDELTDKRVGVFSRDAFLTKEYKRGSIWGFVFNRNGELLLHRRSSSTADNAGLWDKSTGGHIDLTDASTVDTAKRELVEELFIEDAEFSDYKDTKMYMVVDFGEWRKSIRQNFTFVEAFRPFAGRQAHHYVQGLR